MSFVGSLGVLLKNIDLRLSPNGKRGKNLVVNGSLNKGNKVNITGKNNDWYEINGRGWVYTKNIGIYGIISKNGKYLRKKPSGKRGKNLINKPIKLNQDVIIIDIKDEWFLVTLIGSNLKGWVHRDNLTINVQSNYALSVSSNLGSRKTGLNDTDPENKDKDNYIYFYENSNNYYEFTNFYANRDNSTLFRWNGYNWYTSEHAFQAAKYMKATINYSQEHKRHVMMISNDPSPRNAFDYAAKHQDKLWSGRLWSKLKDGIMKEILIAKFSQNPYLNKLLLETKNKIIVENAGSKDCYWGNGCADTKWNTGFCGDTKYNSGNKSSPRNRANRLWDIKRDSHCNKLGQILMDVREIIKKQNKKDDKKTISKGVTLIAKHRNGDPYFGIMDRNGKSLLSSNVKSGTKVKIIDSNDIVDINGYPAIYVSIPTYKNISGYVYVSNIPDIKGNKPNYYLGGVKPYKPKFKTKRTKSKRTKSKRNKSKRLKLFSKRKSKK